MLALADRAFTPGEVRRLIGAYSVSGVRKVLLRLSAQSIVRQERAGTGYVYRLNRDHVGASAVLALATLKELLLERLRDELAGWEPRPAYAASFGSAARGGMRAQSDIDVFISAEPGRRGLAAVACADRPAGGAGDRVDGKRHAGPRDRAAVVVPVTDVRSGWFAAMLGCCGCSKHLRHFRLVDSPLGHPLTGMSAEAKIHDPGTLPTVACPRDRRS